MVFIDETGDSVGPFFPIMDNFSLRVYSVYRYRYRTVVDLVHRPALGLLDGLRPVSADGEDEIYRYGLLDFGQLGVVGADRRKHYDVGLVLGDSCHYRALIDDAVRLSGDMVGLPFFDILKDNPKGFPISVDSNTEVRARYASEGLRAGDHEGGE